MFATMKDVVDTTNKTKDIVEFTVIKNIVDVTKKVFITKPTEDVELDGVSPEGYVVVSYPDIRSS